MSSMGSDPADEPSNMITLLICRSCHQLSRTTTSYLKKKEAAETKQATIDVQQELKHNENDQSYGKSSLGVGQEEKPGVHEIMGVHGMSIAINFCLT